MTKSKTTSISSYGPELMNALRKGSRELVRLEFSSFRLAYRFQIRIQTLKKLMKDTGHEMWPIVARARVSLLWGKRAGLPAVEEVVSSRGVARPISTDVPAVILIRPADSEFAEALASAGLHAEQLDENLLADGPTDVPASDVSFPDSILAKLGRNSS